MIDRYERLWFDLLEQITALERRYTDRAEREWRVTHDILRAVEYRAKAEAMDEARDVMAVLAQHKPAPEGRPKLPPVCMLDDCGCSGEAHP